MRNNQPALPLRPLTAAKWWGASGSAAGKAYFQGSYNVEMNKAGRWLALHNEKTRLPNADTDFATKEEAMRICGIYQDCAILENGGDADRQTQGPPPTTNSMTFDLTTLRAKHRNPRKICDADKAALAKSIAEFSKMLSLRPFTVKRNGTDITTEAWLKP